MREDISSTTSSSPPPRAPEDVAELPWISPIGGLGDMLVLSGVLKQVADRHPGHRFQLVRRTGYGTFLDGHPAIAQIGHPPPSARLARVDYWALEELGPGSQRPYQILARAFGLETPVEETLFVPGELPESDPLLERLVAGDGPLVALAPASEAARKTMRPAAWHQVVDLLRADGVRVVQLGGLRDLHVRNAYSLRGLTTPRQAIAFLRRCDLLLASDSFLMHAAHHMGKPAVIVWGPTDHRVYGWPEHVHLQMPKGCGLPPLDDCIGPKRNEKGRLYPTVCPQGPRHCVDQADPREIHREARRLLGY